MFWGIVSVKFIRLTFKDLGTSRVLSVGDISYDESIYFFKFVK